MASLKHKRGRKEERKHRKTTEGDVIEKDKQERRKEGKTRKKERGDIQERNTGGHAC